MNSYIMTAIGALDAIACVIVLLAFTFTSEELPHLVFYIVFGLFFWFGIYIVVETLCFKVIVKNKTITVCKNSVNLSRLLLKILYLQFVK